MSFEVDTGGFSTSQPQSLTPGSSPTFAGLTLSGMTAGSVLFAGAGGAVSQDNSSFFWNNTTKRLGVGTASPSNSIDAYGGANCFIGRSTNFSTGVSGSAVQMTLGAATGDTYGILRTFIAGGTGFGNTALNPDSGNVGIRTNVIPAMLTVGPVASSRSYNVLTDASNGEWAYNGDWIFSAGTATYGTDKNGTGVNHGVQILTGGTAALSFDGTSGAATFRGLITTGSATLHATSVNLTNGAAAQAGTLLNAPVAGNPTKWIPVNDNGTIRYLPAW